MAKNKGTSQEKPLLFINQVKSEIQSKQQAFVIKKAGKEHQDRLPLKKSEVRVPVSESPVVNPPEELVKEQPRKKRINEMDIEEKIRHLMHLPNNMPKILCQFITENDNYKGIVVTFEGGVVGIRTISKPEVIKIPIKQLKAVNVLGF